MKLGIAHGNSSALTLDDFMVRYATAPEDRRREALLAATRALEAGVRPGLVEPEPYVSLKELSESLGFKHYSSLHRLGIQSVGESWGGGRLRYRRSVAEAYLRSEECAKVRERLREDRRKRDGDKKDMAVAA